MQVCLLEGGSPVEFAAAMGDGATGSLDISPGEALLSCAFGECSPQWKIAVIPVSGGPYLKTLKVPGGISRLRWSPAGTGLQFLKRPKRGNEPFGNSRLREGSRQRTKLLTISTGRPIADDCS
jgi:hypothetical protein